ncbi:MAG: GspH/FimT family pseudopilin [Burkholderiaceae bacterium]
MDRTAHRHRARAPRAARGLTLIEMMVTVSVLIILLAVGVPSFRDLIDRNRIAAEVNSLISDLQFARSEAIRQGLPVIVCASSDGTGCSGNNTWHGGWIVFTDVDGSGTKGSAAAEPVMRQRTAFAGSDTLADASAGAVTQLAFNREGFASLGGGTVMLTLRTSPANSAQLRCVEINRIGRQVLHKAGDGACPSS